jgi:hypothetical protein
MTINSGKKCAICDELAGGKQTTLSRALNDVGVSNAVMTVSDHFAVIPSVGPLVLGHSLVVTREHSSNVFAGLGHPEVRELEGVCELSMKAILAHTPDVQLLCFEHGSRSEFKNVLCSTCHGHLHQVPLKPDDTTAVLDTLKGRTFSCNNYDEIQDLISPFQEYIVAFSLGLGRNRFKGTVLDASSVPSQFVRKVIADQLGIAWWDWKTNMNANLLRCTLALGFEVNREIGLDRVGSDRAERIVTSPTVGVYAEPAPTGSHVE